jgi:hypothetical protein
MHEPPLSIEELHTNIEDENLTQNFIFRRIFYHGACLAISKRFVFVLLSTYKTRLKPYGNGSPLVTQQKRGLTL